MKKYLIWIVAAALLIFGLVLQYQLGGLMTADNYAKGYFAAGDFAVGVFAAGKFSVGIFSAGIFSFGIFSIGIFNIGLYAIGFFTLAKNRKSPKVQFLKNENS